MSIIGKLAIVVVLLLAVFLAFFDCDHTWQEEKDRRGRRYRCTDCGATMDEEAGE